MRAILSQHALVTFVQVQVRNGFLGMHPSGSFPRTPVTNPHTSRFSSEQSELSQVFRLHKKMVINVSSFIFCPFLAELISDLFRIRILSRPLPEMEDFSQTGIVAILKKRTSAKRLKQCHLSFSPDYMSNTVKSR